MKGQSEEEKRRILSIAGNPKNGLVERLNSFRMDTAYISHLKIGNYHFL